MLQKEDVALRQLDVVAAARLLLDLDALVVVVDRNRQLFLGPFLTDHVLVEELLDFLGGRERRAGAAVLEPVVVGDDVVADLNALVANEDRRARNQLANVVLVLVAEGAPQDFGFPGLFHHLSPLSSALSPLSLKQLASATQALLRMTSSMIPYSLPWSADMM